MAKRPNYDFEKRRKEIARKEKKDAKREERLERARLETDVTEAPATPDQGVAEG